jgi:hypothetical protein
MPRQGAISIPAEKDEENVKDNAYPIVADDGRCQLVEEKGRRYWRR